MSKILVTGGCGFIGRHVVAELLAKGHDVRVLDSLVEQVHTDEAIDLPAEVEVIYADIRNRDAVRNALVGIEAVVHLAAEVGVGQSMYEIVRYVGGNDLATAVLLEELIDTPVSKIVVASSMSIYGEGLYVDEQGRRHDRIQRSAEAMRLGHWEPTGPDGQPLTPVPTDEEKSASLASIYALTKYFQEQAVLIFGRAYGIDATALRLFNVFGAGQALSNPYTGVLVNFAARLANGQPPVIFEDGLQRRDFVHVKDVARAFRLALEKPAAAGHVFNIGSGNAYAIADVAAMLASAMGVPETTPEILGRARAGDIRHCFADISKAQELLGFEPRLKLENALEPFVEWVRGSSAVDRSQEMQRQLQEKGLVS
ncbi:NAD-dependent epimerase/dehydratase family protein [Ciceribacter thiooxidans]|uniref:NAD-dependent epimerase/dehydratase family protein n=1 Tax=Ciceribacter thiooxidans TaxID=1969821 RepID=A0ABV7I4A3_9HYPH|nr:NAD-dependent epimerase/dehydratase family protein [Ciceribacter thiooxidans]